MDLRTQNEQLRRVDKRIDLLVEDIRTELLARDNDSVKLTDTTIKSLLKYIANPLKNLSIDGDEMMLDDMIDLYDKVIAELDDVISNKKYSDEKKLSESEMETFKKAKEILKTDREQGIDVIDQVYTEVIKDQKSGKLEDTYIKRKIAKDKDIDDINKKIYSVDKDISETLRPSLDLIEKLSPEIDLFVTHEKAEDMIQKIDDKLAAVESKLSDDTLSEAEKEVLETGKSSLLNRKVRAVIESDPELDKEEYKQEENEDLATYAERLHMALNLRRTENEEILSQKISNSLGRKIKIAEFDEDKNTYNLKTVSIKERYFPGLAGTNDARPSHEELKKITREIQADLEEVQTAIDLKIDEKSELESKKAELEENIINDIKSSVLSVVPYVERNDGKDLSKFEKFRQRMVFRFKNPTVFWGNKEEVEAAMCKAKIAENTMPIDRKGLLKDVENKQKQFKNKYAVRTKVKSNIYKSWDKNRIPNSRDNGER